MFNLNDNGIYPDGSDCTSRLDNLQAQYPEGRFYAPRGEYLCSDVLIRGNVTIEGDGWGTVFKASGDLVDGIFTHANPRGRVKSLTLDGGRQNGNGVKFLTRDAWSCSYEYVNFLYIKGHALESTGCNDLRIDRCVFQGGDKGFVLLNESKGAEISKTVFQYGGTVLPYAIKIQSTASNHIGAIHHSWFEFTGRPNEGLGGAGGSNDIVDAIIVDGCYVSVSNNLFSVLSEENKSLITVSAENFTERENNFYRKGGNAVNIRYL